MSVLFWIKEQVDKVLLKDDLTRSIHDIKGEYGSKTSMEEMRAREMNQKIRSTHLFKLGGGDILQDIDAVVKGAA